MAIFSFIEIWYNCKRLHSYLDYMSPLEFKQKLLQFVNKEFDITNNALKNIDISVFIF
jgi:hypothetical protein